MQSSKSHPAFKKKSNQSIGGAFFCGAGADWTDCWRFPSGSSSSSLSLVLRDVEPPRPMILSAWRMSSTDIFSDGTSMTTPFTLCRRSTPSLKPRKAASTRNCPVRSRHSRVWLGSGGAPTKRCENEAKGENDSAHVSHWTCVLQTTT